MKVHNVHERTLPRPRAEVVALVATLASNTDGVWPAHLWPRMKLDRGLVTGSRGGHGPIGYHVEERSEDRVRFRFERPEGFDGFHKFEILPDEGAGTPVRHTVTMTVEGKPAWQWRLIFRPLHDALVEDAFAKMEVNLGLPPRQQPWSAWVKLLRRIHGKGKLPAQHLPRPTDWRHATQKAS